ncbi:hypothetical protein PsorP6_003601 [Peronosclerospora sorghi]|uniref:Uncharacterized protein n=1 Tax=Peronosclerospora sorghi TaxID=230839 RepID=A0ACC0VLS2_9STRA|nr:hypothetical protein PsorP6_003601 [Peronosclerospora sorghi]
MKVPEKKRLKHTHHPLIVVGCLDIPHELLNVIVMFVLGNSIVASLVYGTSGFRNGFNPSVERDT